MKFSGRIIHWYLLNKRDLPWRETKDPYAIWLSEVILQQTRVDQGLSYYHRFLTAFPKVKDLADAEEFEVMKLWQGLGYYSRARNLHSTAKSIVEKHGGVFPNRYEDIIALKGIGPYTAAAIASFAFGLPFATVDGNVYRILSRIFGLEIPIDSTEGKKQFAELGNELLDNTQPGLFNQAMMELGALVCNPKNPQCNICPFKKDCKAKALDLIDVLPVKEKKVKVKERVFHYLVMSDEKSVVMKCRGAGDIWQGLFDFPVIEDMKPLNNAELIKVVLEKGWVRGLEKGGGEARNGGGGETRIGGENGGGGVTRNAGGGGARGGGAETRNGGGGGTRNSGGGGARGDGGTRNAGENGGGGASGGGARGDGGKHGVSEGGKGKRNGAEIKLTLLAGPIKHVLTHQHIQAYFYKVQLNNLIDIEPEWTKVQLKAVHELPIPRLIDKFLIAHF